MLAVRIQIPTMADQDRIPMLAGRGAPGKGRDRFKLGLLFLGLSVCLMKPAGAQQMPSVLGLKPGMTLAATEALLASMQPKLNQQSVMTHNPIANGAPATMYIKASSSDAVGNTTIWLRFSLLDGALETINYERDFKNQSDYPSLPAITQTLVGELGPYSMIQFRTLIWQYSHSGQKLSGGTFAFASSPENPHCTNSSNVGEFGNANQELDHTGLAVLGEMYSACDIAYQFIPVSGDGISVMSITEDLVSYKILTDEANALVPALQAEATQKAQQEQTDAAKNKPSL